MGYIQGEGRNQGTLFPVVLDDFMPAGHMCRVIDAFVEKLVMLELGFERAQAASRRPGYDPRDLLKLYLYGYLNQIHSSRRLEVECRRNVELMWLPSDELYWQQGRSTENDFLYVTTQTLTRDQLAKLSDEVGDNRSLLICCAAFRGRADSFPNLTIKKIPSAVLAKCEWGHDDYSLNVANLPKVVPTPEVIPTDTERTLTPKQVRRRAAQPNLFATGEIVGAE
jgi:hypothetical protein